MPESLAPLGLLPRTPCAFATSRRMATARRSATLTSATGFFSDEEVAVAVELVEARLAQGLASGYRFLFADGDDGLDGYVCFRADRAHQVELRSLLDRRPARRRSGRVWAAG